RGTARARRSPGGRERARWSAPTRAKAAAPATDSPRPAATAARRRARSCVEDQLSALEPDGPAVPPLEQAAVVGGHDHGGAPRVCVEEELQDAVGQRGIEVSGGLIREQDGGLVHQRASDGHALLFASGEPPRQAGRFVRETHLIEAPAGALADVRVGGAQHLERVPHVLQPGPVVEELEILEDDPDVAPQVRNPDLADPSDVLAADQDLPAGGLLRAEEEPQERALAGAGRAGEPDELALLDAQGDVVQHGGVAGISLLDVEELDQGPVPASAAQIWIVQGAPLLQVSVPGNEDEVHGMLPQ